MHFFDVVAGHKPLNRDDLNARKSHEKECVERPLELPLTCTVSYVLRYVFTFSNFDVCTLRPLIKIQKFRLVTKCTNTIYRKRHAGQRESE